MLPIICVSLVWPTRMYWLLAFAFAVSFVADSVAHVADPLTVSIVYPVTQGGLAGVALFGVGKDALVFLGTLVWAGLLAVLWQDTPHPDVLLATVAFLTVALVAFGNWKLDDRLRPALVVYFGVGWLAWCAFAAWPSWNTYALYQTTRLAGILLFCRAVWSPGPQLTVTTGVVR